MKLTQLISRIGVKTLVAPRDVEITSQRIYAGDRISDLLNEGAEKSLLITNLNGGQLLHMAQLMDVVAICLVEGKHPDESALKRANDQGTGVAVSPYSLFETCGRIHAQLAENRG